MSGKSSNNSKYTAYMRKPDALTRRWDVYLKEGGNTYETVNPQNLRIFTAT